MVRHAGSGQLLAIVVSGRGKSARILPNFWTKETRIINEEEDD
jgi:hypothetical protein